MMVINNSIGLSLTKRRQIFLFGTGPHPATKKHSNHSKAQHKHWQGWKSQNKGGHQLFHEYGRKFFLLTYFPIELKFWYMKIYFHFKARNFLLNFLLTKNVEKCYLHSCNLCCIVYKMLVVTFFKNIIFLFS